MDELDKEKQCPIGQCKCNSYASSADSLQIEIKVVDNRKSWTHTAAELEVIFVCKGTILLHAGIYKTVSVTSGMLFLLPPGWHAQIKSEYRAELFICKVGNKTKLYERVHLFDIPPIKKENRQEERITMLPIPSLLQTFLEVSTTHIKKGLRCRYYFDLKIEELFFLLNYCYTREEISVLFSAFAKLEDRFKHFMLSLLRKDITSRELFIRSNMSRASFDAKFRKVMGNSPKCYVDQYKATRIQKELSHTSKTIKEMAYEYGFTSESVFIRFCVKHLGLSPGKIKKKNR